MSTKILWVSTLVLAASFAAAQMRTPTGEPAGIGQQPGQPGIGAPGMGHPPGVPENTGPLGTDQTTAQPPQTEAQPRVDDATLEREVHQQLATNSDFSAITARVSNGVVHLEGSVHEKRTASRPSAWSSPSRASAVLRRSSRSARPRRIVQGRALSRSRTPLPQAVVDLRPGRSAAAQQRRRPLGTLRPAAAAA
jgi:hypothetical protein